MTKLLNRFKIYYRLTKPGIIYGNMMNTAAGFFLASRLQVELKLLLATIGGTALVIASACVFNNFIDRDIDAKMTRTKKRALVSGIISSQNALIYATFLGILGFSMLAIFTNSLTLLLGIVAIITYVVVYGVAKRRSVYGTLVGSVAGALPPVAGYTAVTNRIDAGALILFLILVCWQMPHFYAIAIYRLQDYRSANIPVWPLVKGLRSTKIQILIYVFAFVLASLLLTAWHITGIVFAVVMSVIGLYWFYMGIKGFRSSNDNKWARGMFGTSLIVILILDVMLAVGSILP